MASWSRGDIGIWLADAVADGSPIPPELGLTVVVHTVSAAEALDDVYSGQREGLLHWRRRATAAAPRGTPLLHLRPRTLARDVGHREYLRRREGCHNAATSGFFTPWTQRDMRIPATAWGMSNPHLSAEQRASRNRIMYDWVYDGRNQAKGGKEADLCPLCATTTDSQQHLVDYCTADECMTSRAELEDTQRRMGDALSEHHPAAHAAATALLARLWGGDVADAPHLRRLGIWTTEHIAHLSEILERTALADAGASAVRAFQGFLRRIGAESATYVLRLYRRRAVAKHNARQAEIGQLRRCVLTDGMPGARRPTLRQADIYEGFNDPNADKKRATAQRQRDKRKALAAIGRLAHNGNLPPPPLRSCLGGRRRREEEENARMPQADPQAVPQPRVRFTLMELYDVVQVSEDDPSREDERWDYEDPPPQRQGVISWQLERRRLATVRVQTVEQGARQNLTPPPVG
jgi:hypothetical protein